MTSRKNSKKNRRPPRTIRKKTRSQKYAYKDTGYSVSDPLTRNINTRHSPCTIYCNEHNCKYQNGCKKCNPFNGIHLCIHQM